jgi:hypothetical protein
MEVQENLNMKLQIYDCFLFSMFLNNMIFEYEYNNMNPLFKNKNVSTAKGNNVF